MTITNSAAICILTWLISLPAIPLNAQTGSVSELSPIGPEAFEVMRQFFEYDQAVPLDAQIVDRLDKPEYLREKIVFSGNSRNSRVPGYFATPKNGTAPYPCVLLLHGLTSSKDSWWDEDSAMGKLTERLLVSGFAVLSLDAEYHGERLANNDFESPVSFLEKGWFTHSRNMMIQSAIEYRRAMDYLTIRAEIDTSRIGMIGYSMGGIMTFILSAVDSRVGASVACVSPVITVPYLPTAVHNYAPYIKHKPFLMLMANNDERNYSREAANLLYNLLGSKTKDLVFFDSGHMLPPGWTGRAMEWIEKYLE